MDTLISILSEWGYFGLFVASFLAGTAVPFSSEAVMAACVGPLGLSVSSCLIWAGIGNIGGGMVCYYAGTLGRADWFEKRLGVSPEKMASATRFVESGGAWTAFFSFIPILGSAITIALGVMRANQKIVLLSMTLGKMLRYIVVIWLTEGAMDMVV